MIQFLFKGIIRDQNRSLLPILVISIGVFLTVVGSAWFKGVFSDMIDVNANFSTGHVKVMSRAYAENAAQMPNDLALLNASQLLDTLNAGYPGLEWVQRIHFGGLIDVPDEQGETRGQGMAVGQGIDFLSPGAHEPERMNIPGSIVKGRLPEQPGEALISNDFAERFGIGIGDPVTLFGSTMNGGMAFANFTVAGTVRFGMKALDRGSILIDITDAQAALDMADAAGEILGFFRSGHYEPEEALQLKTAFNARYENDTDEFAPTMLRLNDQNGLEDYIALSESMSGIMIFIFVLAMSIVLWNTGLLGGLRRYNEFGIRLAMGEEKKHIYRTLIIESVLIGTIGSVTGTLLGLAAAYFLQEHGISLGTAVQGGSMMMPEVFRARIGPETFYIGFIPGLFSMVLGNALSGIGIYRRQTAVLFKELSV
ncbi:MAG: FtsX-like permease family protein [Phaeodactylibacter sp.]|nr:FtsX-like permease family protein [Phaeodactylibacter sp.]MCB9277237.1 FtsX-like permease family protein [Lewinellaceae bacterium]